MSQKTIEHSRQRIVVLADGFPRMRGFAPCNHSKINLDKCDLMIQKCDVTAFSENFNRYSAPRPSH